MGLGEGGWMGIFAVCGKPFLFSSSLFSLKIPFLSPFYSTVDTRCLGSVLLTMSIIYIYTRTDVMGRLIESPI